ncbi:MAG: DUF5674 family protein [bacterium]|nr:DUF5674 family protein [bacterium]
MLIKLESKVTEEQLKEAAIDLDGYVKFVVDLERNVMTIGGLRHVDGEQLLLDEGSKQYDLWGGGYDMQSGGIDYDSMINIRPRQDNPSRDVRSEEIRKKIDSILEAFLGVKKNG